MVKKKKTFKTTLKKESSQTKFQSSLVPLISQVPYIHVLLGIATALIAFLAIIIWWLFFGVQNSDILTVPLANTKSSKQIVVTYDITPQPEIQPVKKANASIPPIITARSAIAIDVESGETLYAKDEKAQLWPASTTKVMTALISLEQYKLDDILTIVNPVITGSVMGLTANEKISAENLLYGLLVQSANDAAFALASNFPGGVSAFVDRMNQKAVELGLENTHFFDPAGFDNNKQFTTATDLSKLALFAMQNKIFAKIVGTVSITVSDEDYTRFHTLKNVNQLLGSVPGVAGVKTGWTENAKENLVNLTKRNGKSILTVILGSDSRFDETRRLTDWAFASYDWSTSAISTSSANQIIY